MPALVIIGAQWGDEGKGKATDLIAEHIDYVVKFNGGNNAGHTVVIGNEKYALHLLPSGILTPGVTPVISNGVVIDLGVLFHEIEALEARGIDTSKLRISANAHIITPYNVIVDKVSERFLGKRAIGTTGRGIGPTYADKINRVGIRVQDLFDESILRQKVEAALEIKNHLLAKIYNRRAISADAVIEELLSYRERLAPMVADTALELNQALEADKVVLFEGGQATMLDIDHGTYPFVTSSNCVAGNAAAGAGVGPGLLHYVLGITKAYCTRVGGGPFPTELDWEKEGTPGYHMSTVGAEKGVTTGRSRRCGWFDAALLKRSAQVNGLSGLCITKLDVLDGLTELQLCVGYELDGERIDILPMGADEIARCQPIYETLPGWSESSVGVTQYDLLPANAKRYLQRIQETTGVPIHVVSTSPDRDHTILLHHPYQA